MAVPGVIYLFRWADGELAAKNFVASYLAHPAGVAHELHVIFKGFPDQCAVASRRSLFKELPINPIELEDGGYDIGSYFAAARLVTNSRLIFFNGFTELLADNWLKIFDDALSLPRVGLVGATGSWQSLNSYYEVLVRLALHEVARLPGGATAWLARRHKSREPQAGCGIGGGPQEYGHCQDAAALRRGLDLLLRPDRYLRKLFEYERYPNPHVRTNAFMIERSRFLALQTPSFASKSGAYRFESGRRSMTKQIMSQGQRPIVIDRCGKEHEIAEWEASSTYWAGRQDNLIAADNRTRQYETGDDALRQRLHDYAWTAPSRWTLSAHRSRLQGD